MKVNLEQEFAENTTLHGISRVIQSKSVFVKLVWSAVCLTAFGLFAWILSIRVEAYFKYEVTTLVTVSVHTLVYFNITLRTYGNY